MIELWMALSNSMRMFTLHFPMPMQEIIKPRMVLRDLRHLLRMLLRDLRWPLLWIARPQYQSDTFWIYGTSISVFQFWDGSIVMLLGTPKLNQLLPEWFCSPTSILPHWVFRTELTPWQDKQAALPKKVVTPYAKIQIAAEKRMETSLKRAALETYFI